MTRKERVACGPGGGYIFAGMPPESCHLVHDLWEPSRYH